MNQLQTKWKNRTILFLISQSITLFGSTLIQMAIVWYVTFRTLSGVWVAAFSICSYLPQFLISFLAGAWADRYSKKRMIICADAVIALVTMAMAIMMPYISQESSILAGLLIMSLIRSLGAGVQTPAVNAVIPQLVPQEELMRYNGINATMQSVVQFTAPAAAGALLTYTTLRESMFIDVATAIVGIGIFACIALPKQITQCENSSVFQDIKTGIGYAFTDRKIGILLLTYGVFIFLSVPAGFLAQLLVSRLYGDTYWYLTAVELVGFFGMMAGGILMSTWGGFRERSKTLKAGLCVFGMLAIGMGITKKFPYYLLLMFLYGIAITMIQTVTTTMIQEKVKSSMQGRVFGLMGAMYSGFLPVGMLSFGPLADVVPLQWIMIGSGISLFMIAVFSFGCKIQDTN